MRFVKTALVALVAFIAMGLAANANASTAPTLAQLQQLQADVAQGRTPTVHKGVVLYALQSTRDLAYKRNCALDHHGNKLSPNGEWEDADWYGKANPEKIGLDSPEAKRDKGTYRRKLSEKSGFCYLTTSKTGATPWPSAARKGAESRVKEAIKRLG